MSNTAATVVATEDRTNLAADLRAAEAAHNAAVTQKRVLDQQLANAIKANATAEIDWNSANREFFSERLGFALRLTRERLATLRTQLPGAELALRESETALNRVQRRISGHPRYVAALGEQRELISKAVEIAKASWHAPLQNIRDFVERFDEIADYEHTFVTNTNIEFGKFGLPEIRARLDGSRHALPLDISKIDVAQLAKEAGVVFGRLLAV